MKRTILITLGACAVIAALGFVYIFYGAFEPGQINAQKLFEASQAYAQELRVQGTAVPESVPIEELVRKGLLAPRDVQDFEGMEVSVALHTEMPGPEQVLVRVRMPDGQEFAVHGDGSIKFTAK